MSWTVVVDTPWGPFTVSGAEAVEAAGFHAGVASGDDPLRVADALAAYAGGTLDALDRVPLQPAGTDFQRRVWAAVRAIPPGETESYGRLATRIGSVARAVGGANGANPIALFVPCHRVVGQNGALTGYAWGVGRKAALLAHERRTPTLFG
jgi:methylated-DNA-[protein]-cysteine S-methyltransferase